MDKHSLSTPPSTEAYQPPTVRLIGTVADLTRGSGTGPGIMSLSPSGRLKEMLNQRDRDGNRY